VNLSIIVPSSNRPTLDETLDSIAGQMIPGDELLVDVNDDGDWGNAARNRMMDKATRDYLIFMDDDDRYLPGAFEAVRAAVDLDLEPRVHLFRMRYADGRPTLWTDMAIRDGNVSTQMVVVPNVFGLPRWEADVYAADLGFIGSACARLGSPAWHEDVIAEIG